MAMTLTLGSVSVRFRTFVTQTSDLLSGSLAQDVNFSDELTNGTGTDQANQTYFDNKTLAASGSQSYDLAGSLTDAFSNTITFARIKGIVVWNKSTDGILQVGRGTGADGTNAWDTWITSTAADGSEGVFVRPGGIFVLYTPDATAYAVTAGTVDILLITETAAAECEYDLALIGAR